MDRKHTIGGDQTGLVGVQRVGSSVFRDPRSFPFDSARETNGREETIRTSLFQKEKERVGAHRSIPCEVGVEEAPSFRVEIGGDSIHGGAFSERVVPGEPANTLVEIG